MLHLRRFSHHRCFYFQPSHIPSKSASLKSHHRRRGEKLEWYESSSPVSLGQRAKRDGEEDGLNLKKKVGCLHCYEPMLPQAQRRFFLNDGDSSGSSFTTATEVVTMKKVVSGR
ncbi:hypothetical protein YC2023_039198 [Brassica napus]